MKRTAIVTAGTGMGIGHGITTALVKKGWNLVVTARKETSARTFLGSIGDLAENIELVVTDVTAEDAPQLTIDAALQRFGAVDALVNNAGVGLTKKLHDTSDEEFQKLFSVDFLAPMRFMRAALPELIRSKGTILNIGSVHAAGAAVKYSMYAATKMAVEGLTRGIALDYGREGVRANIIHPGLVSSPQNDELLETFTDDVEGWVKDFSSSKQMLPELVTAKQVGELAVYLLSEQARTITGQKIYIDGGLTSLLWANEN